MSAMAPIDYSLKSEMIFLDYHFDAIETARIKDEELISATHTDLDYYLFYGDVNFRIDKVVLDAESVPIIDFAEKLNEIAFGIQDGQTCQLEFTESDEVISFQRSSFNVEITSSYW